MLPEKRSLYRVDVPGLYGMSETFYVIAFSAEQAKRFCFRFVMASGPSVPPITACKLDVIDLTEEKE